MRKRRQNRRPRPRKEVYTPPMAKGVNDKEKENRNETNIATDHTPE
jgi:hypothetical protein